MQNEIGSGFFEFLSTRFAQTRKRSSAVDRRRGEAFLWQAKHRRHRENYRQVERDDQGPLSGAWNPKPGLCSQPHRPEQAFLIALKGRIGLPGQSGPHPFQRQTKTALENGLSYLIIWGNYVANLAIAIWSKFHICPFVNLLDSQYYPSLKISLKKY